MKPIVLALKDLRNTLFSMGIFASLIDSLIVMLVFVLAFMLLEVPWYYSIIPFGVYFAIHHKRKLRQAKLSFVEQKFPDLHEELRTAADNVHRENEIISGLNEDVLKKMRDGKKIV